MRYADEQVESIGDLIEKLTKHTAGQTWPIWYRGHSDATWHLEPKLLRPPVKPPETHLFNRFKQNALLVLRERPGNDFEWLFLMQHYGVPTRLLDWSESPLVAMYFALEEALIGVDGAIWVLLPTALNEKSGFRPDYLNEIPSFDDEHLKNYLPDTIAREQKSRLLPMAAIAPRNSPRMQSQQGVFTISHRDNCYIEDIGPTGQPHDHVWRYIVPTGRKPEILRQLRLLGLSKFSLFPELENLSKQLS
jgi:hypothetical protein